MEGLIHNIIAKRFEVVSQSIRAELQYRLQGNQIYFMHTWVPEEMTGQGVGSMLARAALEYTRKKGYEMIVLCPFLAAYLCRHKEYSDIKIGKITKEMRFLTQ